MDIDMPDVIANLQKQDQLSLSRNQGTSINMNKHETQMVLRIAIFKLDLKNGYLVGHDIQFCIIK